MRAVSCSLIAAVFALTPPARAQQTPLDVSLLKSVTWRSLGPANTSGRIDDLAVAHRPGEPETIYVGTASGGVFKSANAGLSWTPIFDDVDAMMSIGAIAVAPSNPSIVWVGTGEANNRQSSSWGDGVYRSTDGGRTWRHAGLRDTRHIGRIVVHPTNPDVAFVAALGHLWGPNSERGVYKTTDGGVTWKRALFVDEHTGAVDVAIDAQRPDTLYAATYQRERRSWGFNGGGPGSGIYKSTDGGDRWTRMTAGLPPGDKGRIGLAVVDASLVYAIVEAATPPKKPDSGPELTGGLYHTTNGGATWEPLSTLNPRPNYYSQLRVDPHDRTRLYLLGSNRGFLVSTDEGRTFVDTGVTGVHGEDHALWIDPDDANHLIVGGDGGVSISRDRGRTWDFRMNMPIGQFYEIDADMRVPYLVCGGLQDNGEWCVPSAVRSRNGVSTSDAWNIGGGDGFHVKFDPTDGNVVYAESQDGNMARINLTTMERRAIKPAGKYQWNWNTPIVVSSVDPNVLYTGANVLFRSSDRGTSWKVISPDLTAGVDPETLPIMGRPNPADALSHNDGTSPFGSLTAIAESPLDPDVIYTGAEDGTLQVTRNGGQSWINLTSRLPGVRQFTYVSAIVASRHAAGRVFVTLDGHHGDDYRPFVFVSDDFGHAWRSLASGLPETSVNRLREHPTNPHFLVLAHERGVHFSTDDGRAWMPLSRTTNLPPVPTDDIVIHPRERAMILGTHGRGIWILDDIGPLELMTREVLQMEAALAPMRTARQMIVHTPQAWFGQGQFFAPNPSFDAGIVYFLRAASEAGATIEIRNDAGRLVRTVTGPAARGLNRVAWDLRGEGGTRGQPAPWVPTGRYEVTVSVPGLTRPLRGSIEVQADPIGSTQR